MEKNRIKLTVFGEGGIGNKSACIIQFVNSQFVEGKKKKLNFFKLKKNKFSSKIYEKKRL